MPLWLVALIVIGAAVTVALLFRVRRPGSTEGELRRPSHASAFARRLAAQASLAEVLKALVWERATGTLDVTSGDKKCSLYFLFGQLFHAESGELKGEDVLHAALAWPAASWTFDSKSRLPKEETILGDPLSTL